jgi:hypothetical protein
MLQNQKTFLKIQLQCRIISQCLFSAGVPTGDSLTTYLRLLTGQARGHRERETVYKLSSRQISTLNIWILSRVFVFLILHF